MDDHTKISDPNVIVAPISHRSLMAVIVRREKARNALDEQMYLLDKADQTDKSTVRITALVSFQRLVKEYRICGMQVFEVAPKEPSKPILLYLHGGAYSHNFSESQWNAMAEWANTTGCGVIAPNYPLLHKHTASEAHPPVMALYTDIIKRFPANKIFIMGDSAGGGFTLALAQEIRDAGLNMPYRLVLISPWADLSGADKSLEAYDRWQYVDSLRKYGADWAGELDMKNPMVSPFYGDMKGLPPTDVYTGTWEVFYPDIVRLYDKMKASGMNVRLHIAPKLGHEYVLWPCPEGEAARKEISDIINNYFNVLI